MASDQDRASRSAFAVQYVVQWLAIGVESPVGEQVLADASMPDVTLVNRSEEFAQIALQGPAAEKILARLTELPLAELAYYHFREGEVDGLQMIVSRTGYTGEDGFELYLPAAAAVDIWQELMAAGEEDGLQPVGLGARDTLRLEKGYALYGHELSAEISPLEAGLAWITKLDKNDFVGKAALVAQKADGVPRRRVGLIMLERGIPREGYQVFIGDEQVGIRQLPLVGNVHVHQRDVFLLDQFNQLLHCDVGITIGVLGVAQRLACQAQGYEVDEGGLS